MKLFFLLLIFIAPAFSEKKDPLAGAVVQSKEWAIRRTPDKEEEFIGNVSYSGGGSIIHSDWALFQHATELWKIRGKIKASHRFTNGNLLEAFGEKGAYDMKTQKGSILPAPNQPLRFTRKSDDGEYDQGEAGRMEWEGRKRLSLISDVHLWGERLELRAGRADLDGLSNSVHLTGGRPFLRNTEEKWSGAVKADDIYASEGSALSKSGAKSRRITADGKVQGWIYFKRTETPLKGTSL